MKSKSSIDSEEEIVKDDEIITNEPDLEPAEDDFIPYEEQEQVITERDELSNVPIDLIRLGAKIKRVNAIQRGQTTSKQSRHKKKSKTPHNIYL